jgi:hypothetical protein
LEWDSFLDNKEIGYLIISANGRLDVSSNHSLGLYLSFPSIYNFHSRQESSQHRKHGRQSPAFEEAEDVPHPQNRRCLDRKVEAWS